MSTVVITGGSRGIGRAAVELFAQKGHRVFFLYEKNDAAAMDVAGKTGATPIRCDVADSTAVKAAFRQIGDVDRLICSIVTVSSMWGRVGSSCEAAYSATKGAVIALTKALAKELGPSGIRVNCVAPGVILTDMCAQVDPETLEELAMEAPLGRNGRPEDVAKAMAYLAEADFVTGNVLNVDGGFAI